MIKFDAPIHLELMLTVDQIFSLNEPIAALEEMIGGERKKVEMHENLTRIKGTGGLSPHFSPVLCLGGGYSNVFCDVRTTLQSRPPDSLPTVG